MFRFNPRLRAGVLAAICLATSVSVAFAVNPSDRRKDSKDFGSFVVHEWGTFLSVQGSDGKSLGGMVDSEENLPKFVRERQLDGRNRACIDQKMETPVTYFYVDRPRSVSVRVAMKNGLLTHWYPATKQFGPPVGREQSTSSTPSFLDWGNFDLVPDNRVNHGPNLPTPGWKPVSCNDTWRFARETDAAFVVKRTKQVPTYSYEVKLKNGEEFTGIIINQTESETVFRDLAGRSIKAHKQDIVKLAYIRDGSTAIVRDEGEWEKFLFYRGLGSLDLPLEVRSSGFGDDVRLMLHNRGNEALRGIFVLRVDQGKARIASIPDMQAQANSGFALSDLKPTPPHVSVKQIVANALVRAGLYSKEASAMVNTWEKSYFQTDGIRVLYIIPRSDVDEIIPIQISPTPDALERVMVGRVEVLTPETELKLSKAVENLSSDSLGLRLSGLAELGKWGRLQEPALHRVAQLAGQSAVRAQAEALIQRSAGN